MTSSALLTEQISFMYLSNKNVYNIALVSFALKVDKSVNIGGVGIASADVHLVILIEVLAENLESFSYLGIAEIIHNLRLKLENEVGTLLCYVIVYVFHLSGGSALLGGEGEYAGAFNPRFPKKFAKFFKFSLTLAGKSCNKTCTQNEIWELR